MTAHFNFANQLAVVTGGSRGIGLAVATALAQVGCKVVVLARDRSSLKDAEQQITQHGGDVVCLRCDLSDENSIEHTFKRIHQQFGVVRILVNNAGAGGFGPLNDHSVDQLATGMDVPVMSAIRVCHQVVPGMLSSGGGSIINILTPASYFPLPWMAPYTASRWALNGFSQSLYLELKGQGIHVGSVCPGRVDTDYIARNSTDIGWWPRITRIFPTLTTEKVAERVLLGIQRKRREQIFPWLLWVFVRGFGLFPKTVLRVLEWTQLLQPPAITNSNQAKQPTQLVTVDNATNWEESIQLEASVVVYAKTIDDIVDIVQRQGVYPSPVRTAGSRHSTTHCGVTDSGTLLLTGCMNQIIKIDREDMTVQVQAGALYVDVAKALKRQGLQFYVNVEIGNLTMGSAACTGTKDASFPGEMGQVCSYLVAATMINAHGKQQTIDESDPGLLQALRSSYGLFGVICDVTFRVREQVALQVKHVTYTLNQFEVALPVLKQQGDSIMYYLFPFSNMLTVELRRYQPGKAPTGRKAWFLRNLAWKTIAPAYSAVLTRWVANKSLRFQLIDGFYRLLQLLLNFCIKSDASFANDQIIRYPERRGLSKYTFSIWAFPEERIMGTMRAYYRFCQQYYKEYGYRCDVLNVGYRIEQDRNPLFSYSWSGNVMTLDPVCTGIEPGWDEFLQAYNRFCSEHNGVPLFNQSKWLTAGQVQKAFNQRISTFNRYRQELDPECRFQNAYFKGLFEPEPTSSVDKHSVLAIDESVNF